MRTTLDLDDGLMREARKRAAQEGRTLSSLIEEGVRLLLTKRQAPTPYRLRWVTRHGTAPAAVDIADRDALLERMEGR